MEHFEPIVAIDVPDKRRAVQLFDKLSNDTEHMPIIKIGMELFYAFGPGIVKQAKERGCRVFLDLKAHDIPNTVERAMAQLGRLGVSFVTVHAAGGSEMMKAGLRGLKQGAAEAGNSVPKMLAITQLTSIDEIILHNEQRVSGTVMDSVQNYARLADESGLAGVVCSAKEIAAIREVTNPDFLCITPGIRPDSNSHDDQKRVVTPRQAAEMGSNGIVVGRPITQSADPVAAYKQIRYDFFGDK
ncbi:orotidine-5'-phosphate decarboxylase [Limosilactobacillus fastidiosus]|uniref:Orotidine 5'-phosphate decarboxylase n=1 Tax=Limosilactobacillus fastidiosus TaxID=2759855 RepID=A0A7W3TYF1_9LACO|nr:orotidine-5'-phosphate decarboxylase [Limosilactobacillus fastidiosus]MBB1062451.1 orotidine-5'-phosphate decarboxylase [Limosilactobacillus fastidiosus]MBB1085598.1 orotidine-5'-phosphate decarboxylase [Limosilactobacillus fastidiosus]MCD7083525.1 orotidine-5'-phosphate decarboxylase [Limosilactobacillus fastidiosus]MCD7086051.1 orotidine-5'-phosphate decarboxylase [Limosilactobacillus fastidiosus]MCD7114305.1 orotidine-5'-phosphate decarboxylase [Limosilactobacillus fastidiosus]